MKNATRLFFLLIFSASLILAVSCGDEHVIDNNNPGGKGILAGKIITSAGAALGGAVITINGTDYYADNKGEFYIRNFPEGNNLKVNISQSGFVSTQKIISVKRYKTSYLTAALFPFGKTATVSGTSGGTVSFQNASVVFPAAAFIDSKGNPFTGIATVRATYFDPTHKEFVSAFPGDFSGQRSNGSFTPIESFGFINVEISNGSEKLNLASGKSANITMPIPASMLAKAPATIPLWWYDETNGMWKEEGFATKNGNNYTGTVIHFSSWNCDQPTQTSYLKGRVVDGNGNPLYFSQVLSKGADYTGQSSVYTDESGNFVIAVKSASLVKIVARYHFFISDTLIKTTPATAETLDIGDITIQVDTSKICIVQGRLIDNGDRPVQGVYIHMKDSNNAMVDYRNSDKNGKFTLFGERGKSYKIMIIMYSRYDSTHKADTVIREFTFTESNQTVDLGDIKLDIGGSTIIGRVVDKDGNPVVNVYVYSNEGNIENGSSQGSMKTDSLGKFSLWVRPERQIDITVTKGVNKKFTVTSGVLGETKDVGDLKLD